MTNHDRPDALDRVLASIDVGLQDPNPYTEGDRPGCVRCPAPSVEGSDFCGPCRVFMLGDTDLDPATPAKAAEVAETRAELEAAAAARPDSLMARLIKRVVREQDEFPARLAAGEIHVWLDDGSTLSGTDARDHVLAGHGLTADDLAG